MKKNLEIKIFFKCFKDDLKKKKKSLRTKSEMFSII